MTTTNRFVLQQMNEYVQQWEAARDRRSIFLGCYAMMTGNMLDALEAGRFADDVWVAHLLEHFAEYYFNALTQYEARQPETPRRRTRRPPPAPKPPSLPARLPRRPRGATAAESA